MSNDAYFNSIRPYRDQEIHSVFKKLLAEDSFKQILGYIFPHLEIKQLENILMSLKSIKEFQRTIVYPYVNSIVEKTSKGITFDGLDRLDKNKSYLFISNHRDIVLDPTLLNKILIENNFDTVEIAIGDNLLIYPWITEVVKLNRSFIVQRNLPVRQMLASSKLLSEYIRYARTERNQNIWIAQKEGRSKDGNDRTQSSLLKMINMSGTKDFAQNFKDIQIVPLSISYEYDPCDYLKANEFYQKSINPDYKKSAEDDLLNMRSGIEGRKGRIHYSFGNPILSELDNFQNLEKNEMLEKLATSIDEQIHSNYKLWPGNFIASDIINNTNKYIDKYNNTDVDTFNSYIDEHLSRIDGDKVFMRNCLLEMYANPVRNFYK